MKSYNSNITSGDIQEGWMRNIGRLASTAGLATALTLGNPTNAASKQTNAPAPVSAIQLATNKQTNNAAQSSIPKTNTSTNASMFDYISKWEGLRTKTYLDHKKNPTVGIGHFLNDTESDRLLIKSLFGGTVNYDDLLNGKQQLSTNQVQKLFNADVKIKEKLASRLMPDYNNFNQETKNAVINGLYRGDLGKKTIDLINKNQWNSAADEYLNHKNFKSGPDQIKRRMKSNADLLRKNTPPRKNNF